MLIHHSVAKYIQICSRKQGANEKKKEEEEAPIVVKDQMNGEIFKCKSEKARQIKQWQDRYVFK